MVSTTPDMPSKKRKLKHPRTSQACNFCKKRKVRCSGARPCEVCTREEVPCEYAERISYIDPPTRPSVHMSSHEADEEPIAVASQRSSVDPPQTFTPSNHVGATSGISFLYGQWGHRNETEADDSDISKAPLVSWGDIPSQDSSAQFVQPHITDEQMNTILDRYFTFISPTYRFLHHPTVKSWASTLVSDSNLSAARKACVLLVCAQTLLQPNTTENHQDTDLHGMSLSLNYFKTAKVLLDAELGPPSLASVQARIALCLYLLSTFRLNECRYCFSFTVTIATTLGIHRKQSSTSRTINTLESESRRRAFWSLYILDGYLSVMLGRPRLLRDDDIDQPFPNNISDDDLTAQELIEDLPQHGNLEAFIMHAKLAKLMALGNDQLYPLHALSNDQLLQRSNAMLDLLEKWQVELPTFLQAKQKTLTSPQTFARQNTILKLAWSHVRLLMTRRCLLMESRLITSAHDVRAQRSIQECIAAIKMVLDTVGTLIQHGQCYRFFWSTQYIALVAISTLYVLVTQGVRIEESSVVEDCLEAARHCHDHLATLPHPGSQAERHLVLLSHLREKAENSLSRRRMPRTLQATDDSGTSTRNHRETLQRNGANSCNTPTGDAARALQHIPASLPEPQSFHRDTLAMSQDIQNDTSLFGSLLSQSSSVDNKFSYMLDFGWENLDTIGAYLQTDSSNSFLSA